VFLGVVLSVFISPASPGHRSRLDHATAPLVEDRQSLAAGEAVDEESARTPVPTVATQPGRGTSRAIRGGTSAVVSLAASLDPEVFHAPSFEKEARALAATLGIAETRDLRRLAADPRLTPTELVATAELLRHARGDPGPFDLPAPAMDAIRTAWQARSADPILAAGAVRALGAFGDARDRLDLLDIAAGESPPPIPSLAVGGLSAARGDAPALELARECLRDGTERRADVALAALSSVAASVGRRLSEGARARCAEMLLLALSRRSSTPGLAGSREQALDALAAAGARTPASLPTGSPARIAAALAVLDPDRAAKPLLCLLSDPDVGDAAWQSAVSTLKTMPMAAPELAALVDRAPQDDPRRALAAEALLRSGSDPFGRARSVLEATRDDGRGTLRERRRAARVLEGARPSAPRTPR